MMDDIRPPKRPEGQQQPRTGGPAPTPAPAAAQQQPVAGAVGLASSQNAQAAQAPRKQERRDSGVVVALVLAAVVTAVLVALGYLSYRTAQQNRLAEEQAAQQSQAAPQESQPTELTEEQQDAQAIEAVIKELDQDAAAGENELSDQELGITAE